MSISVVAVVGAGFMGTGIAESAALAGKHVVLYEPDERPLRQPRGRRSASIEKRMLNGKLTRDEGERPRDRVIYTTRFEDLGGAEAVIEDATLKREVFARLDEQVPDADFLAPNTSSIPIAELAAATSRPQRVLGLCFYSPVPVMRLVEVVAAIDAAETALAAAEESPVTSESARSAPRTARGSSSTRCGSPT